jgi:hypothetical protein
LEVILQRYLLQLGYLQLRGDLLSKDGCAGECLFVEEKGVPMVGYVPLLDYITFTYNLNVILHSIFGASAF